MRHCPRCLTRFADSAEHCPDCEVPLALGEPLLGRDRKHDRDLVSVHRAASIIEAEAVLGMLAQSGLRAVAVPLQELPTTVFGEVLSRPVVGAWGRICVLDYDAVRATRLIRDYLQAPPIPSSEPSDGP